MRTLVVTEFITLDGIVDSPGGGVLIGIAL